MLLSAARCRHCLVTALGAVAALVITPAQQSAAAQVAATRTDHAVPVPTARAVARAGVVTVNGVLDEAAWAAATPITDFIQSRPNDGTPATQRTEVRVLFDDDAIYVGARMFDTTGRRGVQTSLVRRDANMNSDWFQIIFDTYHDHLGRAFFQVNPSGVKLDLTNTGASGLDASWDPIWQAESRIDDRGWTTELRIPFSQLRFSRADQQTWGMQVRRYVQRLNEETSWAHWRLNEAGGPARFGHLEGLTVRGRGRRVELMPYVVARESYVQPQDRRDPFNDGSQGEVRLGGDVKTLVTSNLTLDATINPDFGQVEADPAVVNLSQFENFFPERRPFFIEGAGVFSFGSFSCFFCSNVSPLSAFYSRRIGRAPQGPAGGDFVDRPQNTTILGAAKLTGRTRNGYTVGLLDAVTRRENAVIATLEDDEAISERERIVEPSSNYFVGRLKRDFLAGNLVLGGIATSVTRSLGDSTLASRLPRHSELLGFDGRYTWKEQTYGMIWSLAATNVSGDSAAILRTQRAPARYFQRFDSRSESRELDSSATSLRGYGAYARVAKEGGNLLWETAINLRSPGFENNDIAFLSRADYAWMNANLIRRWTTPTNWYRSIDLGGGGQQQFNWDGDRTDLQAQTLAGIEFPNYWQARTFYIYHPVVFDDRLTRGGPVVKRDGYQFSVFALNTDFRKPVALEAEFEVGQGLQSSSRQLEAAVEVQLRPRSNVQLRIGPNYERSRGEEQYVTDFADAAASGFGGRRYLFGVIERREVSLETRLDVTFTPLISLELFAQPFIATGDYKGFQEFVAPRGIAKRVLGAGEIESFTTPEGNERHRVFQRGSIDPATATEFGNPDFNVRSLRGNAVVRWEYRPGSTLFLVWQQQREHFRAIGDFSLNRDRRALFRAHPDNIFLVKMTYWIGR